MTQHIVKDIIGHVDKLPFALKDKNWWQVGVIDPRWRLVYVATRVHMQITQHIVIDIIGHVDKLPFAVKDEI